MSWSSRFLLEHLGRGLQRLDLGLAILEDLGPVDQQLRQRGVVVRVAVDSSSRASEAASWVGSFSRISWYAPEAWTLSSRRSSQIDATCMSTSIFDSVSSSTSSLALEHLDRVVPASLLCIEVFQGGHRLHVALVQLEHLEPGIDGAVVGHQVLALDPTDLRVQLAKLVVAQVIGPDQDQTLEDVDELHPGLARLVDVVQGLQGLDVAGIDLQRVEPGIEGVALANPACFRRPDPGSCRPGRGRSGRR